MPRITERLNKSGSISYCVDARSLNQERLRRFFPTKVAAQEFAEQFQQSRMKNGELAFALNSKQLLEATHCFEKLKLADTTLTEAVDCFLRHNKPQRGKKLISELVAEFMATRNRSNFKPRYLKALNVTFGIFNKTFGARYVHEISKTEIENWLFSKTVSKGGNEKLSPITIRNYLRDLGMVFKHAVEEGYCSENVVKRIKKPKLVNAPVQIYLVHEAHTLLSFTNNFDFALIPYVAIGFFAGLRSSEMEKLDWNEINLENRRIEVKAENAKTSKRRFVEISENLYAWLKPHEKMEGPIVSPGWRDRFEKIVKRIKESLELEQHEKFVMPKNGLRHSFASYHLARHEDQNKTALQLGHDNTKTLYAHYRELVTSEDAEIYWNIFPPVKGLMLVHQPNKKHQSQKANVKRLLSELNKSMRN